MKTLLIDAGNTTIDFRVYDSKDKKIRKKYRCFTYSNDWKDAKWAKEIIYDQILFTSVVPEFTEFIENLNIDALDIKKAEKLDLDKLGVRHITELGSDFIANLHALKKPNAIVISVGTTTTIMKVKDFKFDGSIIAPGIRISLKWLIKSASLLGKGDFKWSEEMVGFDTKTAISIGAINGHFEMIKGLVSQIKISGEYDIIITGGNANLMETGIQKEKWIWNEQLIFDGMVNLL
ncbi:type III pantothenate kinase [Williamsoniiplasma lucivorax]|uniref:Type III pantothenate kinase n=1 Tax=Williamsoniiplasma lucivorax TaxID=209274 RepID=A0A2S5RDL1_9MOLU|nr:type III pantothenate kinase [Williamsoniiplasma lucivorax]PPE05429.1 type III pantothenate kinase [Williamsoniiplasma lucivorax]